jgi:hypothetical protein
MTGETGLHDQMRVAADALQDFTCPSSDDLGLIRRSEKRGSSSSGLEFKQPAVDAASGGFRWCRA